MTWTSLARRAGEAKGPDIHIDIDLGWLAYPDQSSERRTLLAAAPSTSVDAVLALISAKLPGWDWSLYYVAGRCLADISAPSSPIGYSEEAATPALALLSAFCLAMAAKAGEREGVEHV